MSEYKCPIEEMRIEIMNLREQIRALKDFLILANKQIEKYDKLIQLHFSTPTDEEIEEYNN